MTTKDMYFVSYLLSCKHQKTKPASEDEFWFGAAQRGMTVKENGSVTGGKLLPSAEEELFIYLAGHGAKGTSESFVRAIVDAKQKLVSELY